MSNFYLLISFLYQIIKKIITILCLITFVLVNFELKTVAIVVAGLVTKCVFMEYKGRGRIRPQIRPLVFFLANPI